MRAATIVCLAIATAAAPAHALCFYNKRDFYAGRPRSYTTIPQEFRDSRWVVHARIERVWRHYSDQPWFVYDVRPLVTYKGAPRSRFRLFTYIDSGSYQPDVGIDYLLFLDPPTQDLPRGARNVVQINFNCGQSVPWRRVSAANRQLLAKLAAQR